MDKSNDSKIIKFYPQNVITDDDIINLFLGLLRMVKKQAEDRAEKKYRAKLTELSSRLSDCLKQNK